MRGISSGFRAVEGGPLRGRSQQGSRTALAESRHNSARRATYTSTACFLNLAIVGPENWQAGVREPAAIGGPTVASVHRGLNFSLCFAIAAFSFGSSALAFPVHSRPPKDGGVSFGATSSDQIADGFVLTEDATITHLAWWGGEGVPSTPIATSFLIRFHTDDGSGAPSIAPSSQSLVTNVARTSTSLHAFPGQPIFKYEADLPSPFVASGLTSYFIAIVAQQGNWGWAGAVDPGASWVRSGDGQTWRSRLNPSGGLAFELAIPEPATLTLMNIGMILLGAATRTITRRRLGGA